MATPSSILAWRMEPGGYSLWDHKELDMTEVTWHPLTHYKGNTKIHFQLIKCLKYYESFASAFQGKISLQKQKD